MAVCNGCLSKIVNTRHFYLFCRGLFLPHRLVGCAGIVFTHGVRIEKHWEKVCLGCIAETVRCRKLLLGRDIR